MESTINQVVSRRFVKKQQMAWTLKGAHLLLQTKVLNNELMMCSGAGIRSSVQRFNLRCLGRGRDIGCPIPPAQIPTGGITA